MTEQGSGKFNHEVFSATSVNLATSTFYKDWYPGDLIDLRDVDKIRGDLTLESLRRAQDQGLGVSLVDGGSSPAFIDAVGSLGILTHSQTEAGLSGSRRQAFEIAAESGSNIIFTTEPEKVDLIDSVHSLTQPLINGEADIVIPRRNEAAFETYPPEQARFEKRANRLANAIIKSHGLLPQDAPDIDFWVGARLFNNQPELLRIFTERYDFRRLGSKVDQILNMEIWQNALYIPVIMALAKGFRIKSVEVPYSHPELQTLSEIGDKSFDRKREVQFRSIIFAIIEAVRKVEAEKGIGSKQTRLFS